MNNIQTLEKKLGIGARGVVYLGHDRNTGSFVAIKEIPYLERPTGNADCVAAGAILQEIRVMQQCHHPNLVSYYGARRSTVGVQIVMEYMGGGSVEGLLAMSGKLTEAVTRRYTRDILSGLHYLHKDRRVCHRDIKPGNMLLTTDGHCKLADFGVSKIFMAHESAKDLFMQTTCGTPWYMAPEVISGGDPEEDDEDGYYNPLRGISYRGRSGDVVTTTVQRQHARGYMYSADIWSLGVAVYEMISGVRPFGADISNPTAVLFSIINSAAQPPSLPEDCETSPQLRSFLGLCFVYDKALRPSAEELLAHPWITSGGEGVPLGGKRDVPTAAPSLVAEHLETSSDLSAGEQRSATYNHTTTAGSRSATSLMDAADLPRPGRCATRSMGGRPASLLPAATASPSAHYSHVRQRIEEQSRSRQIHERRSSRSSVCVASSSGGLHPEAVASGFLTGDGHFVDFLSSAQRR